MIDWSKAFNIIVVAAMGALTVFFLVSTVAVAAKGKRKRNGFDIFLRVAASIFMIVSALAVLCAVLTVISGNVCIAVTDEPAFAALVLDDSIVELPLPELFVLLSKTLGLALAAAFFVSCITALIVDCTVANAKSGKKAQPAKTPEQLKREAELERIRRIGESAVKKTASAAKSTDRSAATEKPEEKDGKSIPDTSSEDESDWRKDAPKPAESIGFVGIKESDDPDFDSFDSFDDFDSPEEQSDDFDIDSDTSEGIDGQENIAEQDAEPDMTEPETSEFDENGEEPEQDEYEPAEEPEQEYEPESEEEPEQEYEPESEEEFEQEEEFESKYEPEQEYESEQEEEPEQDEYGPEFDDGLEQEKESEIEPEPEQEYEPEPEPEPKKAVPARAQPAETRRQVKTEAKKRSASYAEDVIEPDRNFYIPKIRKIVRGEKPAEKPVAAKKPAAKKQSVKKQAENKADTKSAAAKKPAAKKQPAKKQSAKKPEVKPASAPEQAKLPVTRRYVILDRRNAVNMFGEYLKERNASDKSKLQSSINTIILE